MRAVGLGIMKGYPDGEFRPGNTINTAEFLKMLSKTFDLPEDLPFDYQDVEQDVWFAKYAGVAKEYKLFPRRDPLSLYPSKKLSRNEVAVAIYKILNR